VIAYWLEVFIVLTPAEVWVSFACCQPNKTFFSLPPLAFWQKREEQWTLASIFSMVLYFQARPEPLDDDGDECRLTYKWKKWYLMVDRGKRTSLLMRTSKGTQKSFIKLPLVPKTATAADLFQAKSA
jgi:hypothetical protein